MKVLLINGSPRSQGNTAAALKEMCSVFDAEGIETELLQIGSERLCGCMGCHACHKLGKCVFDDKVNEAAKKFEESDGIVLASPVYYSSPNGTLISFLDRLFYSTRFDKTMKVGASVAVARRSGCTATFDVLNKYLTKEGMAIATSSYWNNLHGQEPMEALQDEEGLQTMRNLARNMTFLMKSIEMGKKSLGLPQKESKLRTNFIRK